MEIKLKYEPAEQGEGGVVHLHKVVDGELVEIGYLVYGNAREKAWTEEILLENHPNVEVVE